MFFRYLPLLLCFYMIYATLLSELDKLTTPSLLTKCDYRSHSTIKLINWSSVLGIPDTPFNFSKALSWNHFSYLYIKNRKNKCFLHSNPSLYLMEVSNQWEYGESFIFSPTTQSVTFIRENCRNKYKSNKFKSHNFFFQADTIPSKTESFTKPLQLTEYDQIAIFETRGYGNIYHNTEWILNTIRYAQSIKQLPIIKAYTFINPTHILRKSSATAWVSQFHEALLTVFPSSIRPVYLPINSTVYIHRALFITITTITTSCLTSYEQSLYVRKYAYEYCQIQSNLPTHTKLQVLYLAREGNTRQIVNEKEILDSLSLLSQNISIDKVHFAPLSFSQQVSFMVRTDIVFGVHGAGFVNILFLLPNSGVFELFPQGYYKRHYYNMANQAKLFYRYIRDNPIQNETDPALIDRIRVASRDGNIIVKKEIVYYLFKRLINDVRVNKYKFYS